MNEKIKIKEKNEYVAIQLTHNDLLQVSTGWSGGGTSSNLTRPKALELYRAMGKMLGVEDKLLEASKRANEMIGALGYKGLTHRMLEDAIKAAEE